MASIDDSGAYNLDAVFNGVKGTDYNYSETTGSETVWFTETGYATIPYTFPNTTWIVYEIYDVNGTTNPLYGAGTVRGHFEYTTDVGDPAVDIEAWFDAFKISTIGSGYSQFKMKATWYKGSNLANVYTALHTDTNITLDVTDGSYTPTGTDHKIMDALLADDVSSVLETTFITFHSSGSTPSSPPNPMSDGSYVNVFSVHNSTTASINLVDVDNVTTGETADQTAAFNWYQHDGRDSGDDSYVMPDDLMYTGFGTTDGFRGEVTLGLTASTDYRITITGSSAAYTGLELNVTIDGASEKTIADCYANPPSSISWDITTDATPSDVIMEFNITDGDNAAVSGIKIERLS